MIDKLLRDDVLVVVPAFNEEASLPSVLDALGSSGYSFIVVSDGSSDSTVKTARALGARVLNLPINLGVGGALRAGFRHAIQHGFHGVVQVDADGQHPITSIDELVAESNKSNLHMVIGSRFISNETSMQVSDTRRLVMRVLARSASRSTGSRITDASSGFRLIREPLLSQFAKNFPNNYLGDTYEAIVAAGRAGYRVAEIPAAMRSRLHGTSTASAREAAKFTVKGLGIAAFQLHLRLDPLSEVKSQDS